MRLFIAFALLFSQVASAAPPADVWCKVDGFAVSAITESGHYYCAEALAAGQACFTGARSEVVRMINTGFFNWDEEWLEAARPLGARNIGYTFKDGPNRIRQNRVMISCPAIFFGR